MPTGAYVTRVANRRPLCLRHDRSFGVIIADYRLREERTGAEAIRVIQQRFGCDIPALIVTGDTDPERITQAKQSGFAFLHKPVAPGKLRAFLRGAGVSRPPLRAEG